jgi:hypothetical protein
VQVAARFCKRRRVPNPMEGGQRSVLLARGNTRARRFGNELSNTQYVTGNRTEIGSGHWSNDRFQVRSPRRSRAQARIVQRASSPVSVRSVAATGGNTCDAIGL